jgi:ankyrin repeat protein
LLFLFQAAAGGYIEVVKELLKHNADTEAKDKDEMTPLILGIFQSYLFHLNKK